MVMFLPLPSPLGNIKKAFVVKQLDGGKHLPGFFIAHIPSVNERLDAGRDSAGLGHEAVHCEVLHPGDTVDYQTAENVALLNYQHAAVTETAGTAWQFEKMGKVDQWKQVATDVGGPQHKGPHPRDVGETGDMENFSDFTHRRDIALARQNKTDAVPELNGFLLFRQARCHGPAALGDIRQNCK